uniref:L1 transposable element RRM domain-containing protein n=1 Tax=Lepisosteus oculatus TaxID=7918 RepID=W5NNG8_LEPOC
IEKVTSNIAEILDSKLATIREPVAAISTKMDIVIKRIDEVEQRVSDLEEGSVTAGNRIRVLETDLRKTLDRLEDFENRSRRKNVRILGLRENIEGSSPVGFFERWIPETLGMEMKGDKIKLERCHRTGPRRKSGEGGTPVPQAVLLRLHNYRDKQKVREAARAKKEIIVEGKRVSIFQDFSVKVQKKRAETAKARRRLRDAGLRYSFLYPAIIKVFDALGGSTTLSSLKEAENFLKN